MRVHVYINEYIFIYITIFIINVLQEIYLCGFVSTIPICMHGKIHRHRRTENFSNIEEGMKEYMSMCMDVVAYKRKPIRFPSLRYEGVSLQIFIQYRTHRIRIEFEAVVAA